jgi:hypothetical protein
MDGGRRWLPVLDGGLRGLGIGVFHVAITALVTAGIQAAVPKNAGEESDAAYYGAMAIGLLAFPLMIAAPLLARLLGLRQPALFLLPMLPAVGLLPYPPRVPGFVGVFLLVHIGLGARTMVIARRRLARGDIG